MIIELLLVCLARSTSESKGYLGFLQFNIDTDSADPLRPNHQILITLGVSFTISLLCCGLMQLIVVISKKMTSELISLRKNYKQYQGLVKFKEFKSAINNSSQSN